MPWSGHQESASGAVNLLPGVYSRISLLGTGGDSAWGFHEGGGLAGGDFRKALLFGGGSSESCRRSSGSIFDYVVSVRY